MLGKKKIATKVAIEPVSKETKEEALKRIYPKKIKAAIHRINLLKHAASYKPNASQVAQIIDPVQKKLDEVRAILTGSVKGEEESEIVIF